MLNFLKKYKYKKAVHLLDNTGYFSYTNKRDVAELKSELVKKGFFGTTFFDEDPYGSKDYRQYFLDAETLFETGGFKEIFKTLSPLFERMNMKMEVTEEFEEYTDEFGLNHTMTLNGKNYIIFKNFKGFGWGEAVLRFAEIMDDQLKIQNKLERTYLMLGGNDGLVIFLTEKQFEILSSVTDFGGRNNTPMRVVDWCNFHEVDMQNYLQK